MDYNEKKARKEKLSEHVDLGNGRFKDHEIEDLEYLVNNRDSLDGTTKTHRRSYKSFDSEDTYHVEEKETYTFRSDAAGIHIDRDWQRRWDDGQEDTKHDTFDSARDILHLASTLFKK